jgi:histone-binding protein RBBP4
MRITHRISHDGDVNRARLSPSVPSLIASRSSTGKVLLAQMNEKESSIESKAVLGGLEGEGFGLSWSKAHPNHIASASHGKVVCEWDIER